VSHRRASAALSCRGRVFNPIVLRAGHPDRYLLDTLDIAYLVSGASGHSRLGANLRQ
jgi:hypothetical protein